MAKKEIPAYLFTGFLESGKTNFILHTLNNRYFFDNVRTLLVVCEEGLEEYDEDFLKKKNISMVVIDEEEGFTTEFLEECNEQYKPEQVMIEYNGTWNMETVLNASVPEGWILVQIIATVNSKTYDNYRSNMGAILMEQIKYAQLVIFNRCDEAFRKGGYARSVKAVNRRAQIVYEMENGESEPADENEELPFDISQDFIDLADEDFGIWYFDAMDNYQKYNGKTVKLKGMVFKSSKFGKNMFVPGRFAMTCCADDVAFIGFICKSEMASELEDKSWVNVTAKVKTEYVKDYRGKGPVLYAISIEKAEKPEEELVYLS